MSTEQAISIRGPKRMHRWYGPDVGMKDELLTEYDNRRQTSKHLFQHEGLYFEAPSAKDVPANISEDGGLT